MPDARVATRYADALIDVAAEADAIDAVGADLKALIGLLDAHESLLRGALCTPVFSSDERSGVLADLLPKVKLNPLTANFVRLLSDKGRMDAIDEITAEYSKLADARAGRVTVRITTAEAMSPAIEKEVKDALSKATGKEVVLDPRAAQVGAGERPGERLLGGQYADVPVAVVPDPVAREHLLVVVDLAREALQELPHDPRPSRPRRRGRRRGTLCRGVPRCLAAALAGRSLGGRR